MAWGGEALADVGPFALGARVWRTTTRQDLGVASAPAAAEVAGTSFELVGRGRLGSLGGSDVFATASAGRLALRYRPARIAIASPGGGAPITVDLSPIDEWIGGGGLGVRRQLGGRWTLESSVERRIFGLDTAHRNGNAIEMSRASFGDWSARLGLARLFGRQ